MIASSTRTSLFGIFILARRSLTAAQVIALARPLGISATNVKSHLSRMVVEGALERKGPRRASRHAPSSSKAFVVEGIQARLERREEPWYGEWVLLTLSAPRERADRDRLRAALWFDGFRPWNGSTYLRPCWPRAWAASRARFYLARVPGVAVKGRPLTAVPVERLYGLDELHREALALARRIRARQVSSMSPERAFRERIEMGGLVARVAGHDPRLPPLLWGRRTGMRELARAFAAFEKRVAPPAGRFLEEVLSWERRSSPKARVAALSASRR
jgi:DNA-binding transcriptional regulator PaaX